MREGGGPTAQVEERTPMKKQAKFTPDVMIHNTRKQKAAELIRLLEEGPLFNTGFYSEFNVEVANRQFQLWSQAWIIPIVKRLVPELKVKNHENL
jgi:hypothetical protein